MDGRLKRTQLVNPTTAQYRSLPPVHLLPAAMPQTKFTREASVDLLLEGLEMMFRLKIVSNEEVIELWTENEKIMMMKQ